MASKPGDIEGIVIRSSGPGDAVAIAGLLGELGYPTGAEAVESRLSRLTGHAAIFVAEVAGEAAGLATGHIMHVIHADRPVAVLSALVVGEAHRNTGLGRRLVGAIESWAREQGAYRVTVASGVARAGAHAFYERLGYEHTARRYSRLLADEGAG